MKKIPSVFQRNYETDCLCRDEVVTGMARGLGIERMATAAPLPEPPPRERSAAPTDQDTPEPETASERRSGAVALKTSEDAIRSECNSLAEFLIAKNRSYGDSALDPIRVFSRADQVEQLLVRIDDKLSRIKRGSAAGEDVELDLLGYLVLLRIARNRDAVTDGITPVDPGSLRHWLTSYAEECRESRDAAADDGDYESALRHRTRVEVLEDVLARVGASDG